MLKIRNLFVENKGKVIDWIKYQEEKVESSARTLYFSVDVRESKYKLAPVDINLFPSGFNNLKDRLELLTKLFKKEIGEGKKIGLVVENFTRNEKYLDNVRVLKEALKAEQLLTIDSGKVVSWDAKEAIKLQGLDLIILNNDLTGGCPEELLEVWDKVVPSPEFGWYRRKKNDHLELYNNLVADLVRDLQLDLDPWLLSTLVERSEKVDFKKKTGLPEVAMKVDTILLKLREKYTQHSIKDKKPYVFIKSNNGTFGMGMMIVYSGDKILNINKKKRHSMALIKQGIKNHDVIIQEGIHTDLEFDGMSCENILYSIGGSLAGKLIRYNNKSNVESLNAPGMAIEHSDDIDFIDHFIASMVRLVTKIEGNNVQL